MSIRLLDTAITVEKNDRAVFHALRVTQCLYCRQSDQAPSAEHVIPAAFGRHADVLLPSGAVCRTCNNQLGRQIDEALVHLIEVQMIRGLWRVPDARGRRIRKIELSNGHVGFDGDQGMQLVLHDTGGPGPVAGKEIALTAISKRRNSGDQLRRATRSLLKIGLALAYLRDPVGALSETFDPARAAVNGEPYSGYVLQGPYDIFEPPDLEAKLRHSFAGGKMMVSLRFGGFHWMADLILGVATAETRDWARANDWRVVDIAPRNK